MTLTKKTKPAPEETTLTSVELNKELYKKARPALKRLGYSLREIVEDSLKEAVETDKLVTRKAGKS